LPVQRDGSVALPPAGSPQDELVPVLPPDDSAAPREQRAVHSQQAAPDDSPADSPVRPQADQVEPQQADSSACPSLASQVLLEVQPSLLGALPQMLPDANLPLAACPVARRDALPSPVAARQTMAEAEAESSSRQLADSPLPLEAQPRVLR
jgi:hypothetical protein